MRRHLAATRKCVVDENVGTQPDKPYECEHCRRSFTAKRSLRRHVQNSCKVLRAKQIKCASPDRATHAESTEADRLAELERQNEELRARLEAIERAVVPATENIVPATTSTTVYNTVVNHHIHVYGQESLSHIDQEKVGAILMQALPALGQDEKTLRMAYVKIVSDVTSLIMEPMENKTAFLQNVRENKIRLLAENGWEDREGRDAEAVVDEIYKRTFDTTFKHQPWQEDVGGEANFEDSGKILRGMADNEQSALLTGPAKLEVRNILAENKRYLREMGVIDGNGTPIDNS